MTVTAELCVAQGASDPQVTLRTVLDHIKAEVLLAEIEDRLSRWDQSAYRCCAGCCFCFAGHAIQLHPGYRWREQDEDDEAVLCGDRVMTAREAATEILGLSWGEGALLFKATNTLEDLEQYVDHIERFTTLDSADRMRTIAALIAV